MELARHRFFSNFDVNLMKFVLVQISSCQNPVGPIVLSTLTKQKIEVVGKCFLVNVRYKDQWAHKLWLYVVGCKGPPLLNWDWLT